MDRPVYSELRQITRHGAQVFATPSIGEVEGNFYAVEIFVPSQIRGVTIDGSVADEFAMLEVQGGECDIPITLYNVSSIWMASGFAVCYTTPPLTGQIES
jgi:hypothetical protein